MNEPSSPPAGAGSAPLAARMERWLDDLSRPRWSPWLLGLYAPLAWLALLILPTQPPGVSLDWSWMAVLNHAAAHGWQHGVDLAFTYGPLGYLNCTAQYESGFFLTGIVYQLLFKAFYVGVLCRLGLRLPRAGAVVFLVLNVLLPVADDDSIYLLAIGYTGLLWGGRSLADWCWGLGGVAFAALATLVKGSYALYVGVMLVCVGGRLVLDRRWRQALWAAGVFGGCLLAADAWIGGQSLRNLPAYLRLNSAIIGGYSSAMSVPMAWSALPGALVFYGLVWTYLAWSALRSPADPGRRWSLFLIVSAGLFLAWKAGMTRSDVIHQPTFFLYALALGSAGRVFFPPADAPSAAPAPPSWQTLLALAPAFALWTLCVQSEAGLHYSFPNRVAANLRWLLAPAKQHARLERLAREDAAEAALPRCQAVIGRATVDLFGWEQLLVLKNGLNYRPAPVFQAYSAYTPRLVRANTAFYRSEKAPEFVLFKPRTIDDRFPTLDNAGVLLELLYRYRGVLIEKDCLLLQRRAADSPEVDPTAQPLASGELRPGEKLVLPKTAGALWCELDIRPNLPGQLLGFAYQLPRYELEVFRSGSDAPTAYRMVPDMAGAGFLLTPVVALTKDFLRLRTGRLDPAQRAEAIAIRAGFSSRRLLRLPVRYRLYELPPFASSAEDGALEKDLLRVPVQAELPLRQAEP